ncbi:MAG TPA: response regulator [Rhizomicrobium sp.]|nr:response regulator [Rhizomicrobium sp.]
MEDRPILETPDTQHKILILDDEPAIAEPFETALQELGHDVRSTTDGKEAVKLIDLFAPDLLVTDINLPEIDILDLIAELRRSRPRLRIIAISGNSHLLRLAAQHGADHVLPKPFRVGELNALVEKLLGR